MCYRLTYDMLRRTKNCREIIESASRPIENLDKRLTFDGGRGIRSGQGFSFQRNLTEVLKYDEEESRKITALAKKK